MIYTCPKPCFCHNVGDDSPKKVSNMNFTENEKKCFEYECDWTFDMAGIISVCYAVPLFFLLRNAPRASDVPDQPKKSSPLQAFAELLGNKYFLMLVIYFTVTGAAGWVVKDWMA